MQAEKNILTIEQGVDVMKQGGVIAYPTEAVYGLGCDPTNASACMALRSFKDRQDKGFILVAHSFAQIVPWVDWTKLSQMQLKRIRHSWPGPVTWVLPAGNGAMQLTLGPKHTIAIRVSAHSVVAELCEKFGGPIVSTSANRASMPPAKRQEEVLQLISGEKIAGVVAGELGTSSKPTKIIDALTDKVLRD